MRIIRIRNDLALATKLESGELSLREWQYNKMVFPGTKKAGGKDISSVLWVLTVLFSPHVTQAHCNEEYHCGC